MNPSKEQTSGSRRVTPFDTGVTESFVARDLSNLCGPDQTHTSIIAARHETLPIDERRILIEAEIFFEASQLFGSEGAIDLLHGCQVRGGEFDEEATALVMQHITPEMIDLTSGLQGVFGSCERETAATQVLEHSKERGDWEPVTVNSREVAKYLDGTPFAPHMPAGNCFVQAVQNSSHTPGESTVLPNYRLIFRAWKASA
jgi:hypothetical protein